MRKTLFLLGTGYKPFTLFIYVLLLASLFPASHLRAEEMTGSLGEIIVTATKIEEAAEETTSTVTVIKSDYIKKKNAAFVTDVLRSVPQISLVQNGGSGKQAAVFLRGGDSTHALVLIDGVKVNSATTGSFDFSGINTDDIERIEIAEGPQSTVYGSEAMSGVINIITKKGKGAPQINASFESGSYGTYKPSVTLSGGDRRFDYRLSTSYFCSDGISAAKTGTEKDGYINSSLSVKIGFRPSEKAEVEVTGRYQYDRSELDSFGTDDLNYIQHKNHYMFSAKGKVYLLSRWEQVLTVSKVRDALKFRDQDTSYNNMDIFTDMSILDWQHNLFVSKTYTVSAGAEYRNESGENKESFDRSVDNKALYINNTLHLLNDDLTLNAGMRHDSHETFGGKTTYRTGLVYNIRPAALRFRASYATGFRAPSLNELYYSDSWGSTGNPDLKPEKSSSWEIGVEKGLFNNRAVITATCFEQAYKDLIQWIEVATWTYSPMNVSEAKVKGIETSAKLNVTESVSIRAGYTHLDAKDISTGLKLERRPDNKFTFSLDLNGKKYNISADYIYSGGRYDDASNTRKLPPYSVVNLSGTYAVSKEMSLFARAVNIFDVDYEEASGYKTEGFSLYGGIKITL